MLKSIELYAGAGGTALGLCGAGFTHIAVIESDKKCIETLEMNTNWNLIHRQIKDTNLSVYKDVDLLSAGFPCQPFSYAGNRKGVEDERGNELFVVLEKVKECSPKIVFLENVKGFLKISNGEVFNTLKKELIELGYTVYHKVLNAVDYNVAQKRERLIIIAIRNDIHHKEYEFPAKCTKRYTLKDVLVNIPESKGQSYSEAKRSVLSLVPPGGCWRDLPIDIQKSYMGASFNSSGGKTGMARRLSWNEPCLTLTCSPAQKQTERCHPSETRPLTIREYARIQGFPNSWEFSGSMTSQYKQIGNACPVSLALHIGMSIEEYLNERS